MSRRRPSFRAYVRRRWRALGLVAVLLAGALLVLAVTDRGHDPLWEARGILVEQAIPSPDGRVVYVLVGEGGNISRLEARSGVDGAVMWESPMAATRALLRAGDDGVAVATDFPYAFLTSFGKNGTILDQVALEGNPRAMALEGGRLALALQAAGNPVLVYENGSVARVHRFEAFANALDLRAGHLAVGTGGGEVVLFLPNGTPVLNESLPITVRSLRLNGDASALVVGGYTLASGDLSGAVAMLDRDASRRIRWTQTTAVGVGFVDLDEAGILALAVEESPPLHKLRVFDAGTGALRWTRQLDGIVPRDDAGAYGGAAISPDARVVVAATLRGGVTAFGATTGEPLWSYGSPGSTAVAFARDEPTRFAANARIVQSGDPDALLLFHADVEPAMSRLPALALLALALAATFAALLLGIGFWRVRRSY